MSVGSIPTSATGRGSRPPRTPRRLPYRVPSIPATLFFMIFSWWKRRRRRRILAQPFPPEWLRYLHRNVAHYRYLSEAEQGRLRDDLRIFIAEKHWEGCGGLKMSDEIK